MATVQIFGFNYERHFFIYLIYYHVSRALYGFSIKYSIIKCGNIQTRCKLKAFTRSVFRNRLMQSFSDETECFFLGGCDAEKRVQYFLARIHVKLVSF